MNNDIVILFEANKQDEIDRLIAQMQYLFADDPFCNIPGKKINPAFYKIFLLKFQKSDFTKFLGLGEENFKANENSEANKLINQIGIESIDLIVKDIEFEKIIRKQAICTINDLDVKVLFHEIFYSALALKDILNLGPEFDRKKLLNRYLIEKTDEEFLKFITHNSFDYFINATNISLSLSAVSSENFIDFQALFQRGKFTPPIIDLSLSDVFLDLNYYKIMRDYLKSLGFKICLTAVDYYAFTQISREELGFDLIKLNWDEDSERDFSEINLKKAVIRHGTNRVIMREVNCKEAIVDAKKIGILMAQGWEVGKKTQEFIVT